MYPTVLGANIGTCITGVLAALAADASKLYLTLQVAYAHLLFNISGIIIWYVIWPFRVVPINAAKFMGATTAKYRWFAVAYLFVAFFIVPAIIMGISIGSTPGVIVVISIVLAIAFFILIVNVLQARRPNWLPAKLRTWEWLPVWLRSLEPTDRVICGPFTRCLSRINPCKGKCKKAKKGSATSASGESTTANSSQDLEIAMSRMNATAESV
jgi:sodium-dependent phosphate cotransporter